MATTKFAVSVVEDRILAEMNQRAAERIRERIQELFEPPLDVVRDVAGRHADA